MTDPSPSVPSVRIGLLGCGIVGTALVALVAEQRNTIAERAGVDLVVSRVAVRNTTTDRGVALAAECFTTDAAGLVTAPDIDIVVEVIGGIEPARELVLAALAAGKPVVTANKELLANHGAELYAAADAVGVDLLFEAAVAGGIPLIRVLRESLLGEPVERVMGIVNGTTNYILSQMSERGASYDDALAEAQSLGYAESDPTADVEGFDAAAKAAIIASIAFGTALVAGDVYHEGISEVTTEDIAYAAKLGYAIKLLAVVERAAPDGPLAARVHPTMIPLDHPLAAVRDSFNAVFIEGGAVGELMLYGRGAGGPPTASAVLGDVIDAALNSQVGSSSTLGSLPAGIVASIDDLESAYYLNVEVLDRPGVLAAVASVFGANQVSIRLMEQEGLGDEARLVFITHRALESDVQATLSGLRDLDSVRAVQSLLRVVSDD